MSNEKAGIRNRPIETGNREAQDNRVNFSTIKKITVKMYLKVKCLLILWQQQLN